MISRIIFDLLDINGDGSIDSSEIRLALQEFGFGPSFLLKKQVVLIHFTTLLIITIIYLLAKKHERNKL